MDYYFAWVYNQMAFFLINIILMNVLFGIIIDSFKGLREGKNQKDVDKVTLCFICGKDRNEFNKIPGGFAGHTKHQHNLFDYLKYLYYLTRKDKTEHTGIETIIYDKIKQDKTDWFPKNAAMCLGEYSIDEKQTEYMIDGLLETCMRFDTALDSQILQINQLGYEA